MPHDIFEDRFVAIREPAWHRIGQVFETPVLPSEAISAGNLDLGAEVLPLIARRPDGSEIETGLVVVGHATPDGWQSYGTASEFEVASLNDIAPQLDEVAAIYPLSAAGTLAKGAEIFFTFDAGESEIVGEQYREYLVYRHSYKPGVANTVMWTPVRVVCRNTLVTGEGSATIKLATAHTTGVTKKTSAAIQVAAAIKKADAIKNRLESLAKIQVHDRVDEILDRVYSPYRPKVRNLEAIKDLVPDETFEIVVRPTQSQNAYVDRLIETAKMAYDRFCDEFPSLSGSGYALYQAVVEVADHRKGRESAAESAVVGARAGEKVRAWQALTSLLN